MIDDVITHDTCTLFVQKIFVDSDRHEFAMTQNARKDVVGIVTFDLVGFTSHQIHYYTTMV